MEEAVGSGVTTRGKGGTRPPNFLQLSFCQDIASSIVSCNLTTATQFSMALFCACHTATAEVLSCSPFAEITTLASDSPADRLQTGNSGTQDTNYFWTWIPPSTHFQSALWFVNVTPLIYPSSTSGSMYSLASAYDTRDNIYKLISIYCKYEFKQKHYFTNRVIPVWNSLPNSVVMADSINSLSLVSTSSGHCTILYMIAELSY